MKKLGIKQTEVFCQLIDGIKDHHEYVRILNGDRMPLDVIIVNEPFEFPFDGYHAQEYELCQYYDINGDIVRDPLMGFVVLDRRGDNLTDFSLVEVYPYKFERGLPYVLTQSIKLMDEEVYQVDRALQRAQVTIAESWLDEILEQGFLEQLQQGNIEQDDDDDNIDDND